MATQRWVRWFRHAPRRRVIEFALILVGVLEMATYALDKLLFDRPLVGDVRGVWIPFAEAVLAGGAPYLAEWDNKPPLFQFVNIAAAWTGHYTLVFFLTIGLANGIAAVLLWRLCRQYGYDRIGLVAAGVLLAVMATASFRINPRQYAAVFMLLALLANDPVRSGLYIAVAGLFSQFSVLLIPAIVWLRYRTVDLSAQWIGRFIAAGLATVAATFGVVAAVWSLDAAVAGFRYSFLASGEYAAGYADREISLYADPIGWVYNTFQVFRDWGWGILAAGGLVGAVAVLTRGGGSTIGQVLERRCSSALDCCSPP